MVVDGLEALDEESGDGQRLRHPVDEDGDASLEEACREHVRPLGIADRVEEAAPVCLQKRHDIARREDGLRLRGGDLLAHPADERGVGAVGEPAQADVRAAQRAHPAQLVGQAGRLHAAAQHGHVRADGLGQSLMAAQQARLAHRLGDAAPLVPLEAEAQRLPRPLGAEDGESRVDKAEQVRIGIGRGTVERHHVAGADGREERGGVRAGRHGGQRGDEQLRGGRLGDHPLAGQQGAGDVPDRDASDREVGAVVGELPHPGEHVLERGRQVVCLFHGITSRTVCAARGEDMRSLMGM